MADFPAGAMKIITGTTSGTPDEVTILDLGVLAKSILVYNSDGANALQYSLDDGVTFDTLASSGYSPAFELRRNRMDVKSAAASCAYKIYVAY